MQKPLLAVIAAIVAVTTSLSAHAVELVTNGGFETGNLSGWTTSGPTGSLQSCQTNWTVASNGGSVGCLGHDPGNPIAGTYAAYTSNDGAGPLTYSLMQSIAVPVSATSGILSFDWIADTADPNRKFSVSLGGVTIFTSTASTNDQWVSESLNVSSILSSASGNSLVLEFDNYIPGNFTGCCNALGLDAVSLSATTAVPEPASIAMLGAGLLGLRLVRRRQA